VNDTTILKRIIQRYWRK